jgi:hypothetical protein
MLEGPRFLVQHHQAAAAAEVLAQHAAGHAALRSAGAEAALSRLAPEHADHGSWVDPSDSVALALAALRAPAPSAPPPAGEGGLQAGFTVATYAAAPTSCVACGAPAAPGRPLRACGACHGPERWCGVACQRASWPAHKRTCSARRAAGRLLTPHQTFVPGSFLARSLASARSVHLQRSTSASIVQPQTVSLTIATTPSLVCGLNVATRDRI